MMWLVGCVQTLVLLFTVCGPKFTKLCSHAAVCIMRRRF